MYGSYYSKSRWLWAMFKPSRLTKLSIDRPSIKLNDLRLCDADFIDLHRSFHLHRQTTSTSSAAAAVTSLMMTSVTSLMTSLNRRRPANMKCGTIAFEVASYRSRQQQRREIVVRRQNKISSADGQRQCDVTEDSVTSLCGGQRVWSACSDARSISEVMTPDTVHKMYDVRSAGLHENQR